MDRERLVQLVLAEVERQLGAQTVPAAAPVRHLALIEPGPGLRTAIARLAERGDVTAVLVSRAAKAPEAAAVPHLLPIFPDDPDRIEAELLPHLETLILPNLRPATAARIALGLDNNTVPRLVHAALWANKQVEVTPTWPSMENNQEGKGGTAYRALYTRYLEQLRGYGVKVEPWGGTPRATSDGSSIGEPGVPPQGDSQVKPEIYSAKLLTEGDVARLAQSGTRHLTLPPGTLVTALALDTARRLGITIERR